MTKPLDSALNHILSSAQLPTLPAVAIEMLALTEEERDTIAFAGIAELISQDVALSAKILKVANSSFYSFPHHLSSISQALALLGMDAVRNLVLGFSFLSMDDQEQRGLFNFELFWEQSLVGATAARLIAGLMPEVDADTLFTAGLLRNLGQLIFALTMPARYDYVLERLAISDHEESEIALEEEYLALPHTIAGQEVARVWGLPPIIGSVIGHHHDPGECSNLDAAGLRAVRIVFLADLVTRIFYSSAPERHYRQLHLSSRDLLGLDGLVLKGFLQTIDREIAKVTHLFDVPLDKPLRPVADIIQEANIRLSLLNVSYEEMHQQLTLTNSKLEQLRRQLDQKNRQLEQLANIDGLTEIHNHRFFQHFLQTEINRAIGNKSSLSLLMVDIDHFKQFNDCHGHQTGDFILKELCMVAQKAIREYDLMARYGGEEFAFVLPDTLDSDALTVAYRLLQTIADHDFFDGGRHYRVTVSIGVVSARPDSPHFSSSRFIDQADEALYDAKRNGRNQVVLFTPQPTPQKRAFGYA